MKNTDEKLIKRKSKEEAKTNNLNHHVENNGKKDEVVKKESINIIEYFVTAKFSFLPQRWQNFVTRFILTQFLLIFFIILVLGGFFIDYILLLGIIVQCYKEFIRVGYNQYKQSLPLFRSLGWYFFTVMVYYSTGILPLNYFSNILGTELHTFLIDYHQLISFFGFIFGIMIFVLTLKKHHMKKQFGLLAWFNIASLFITMAFYSIFKNMQVGLIWVFLPMSLIVTNDISAYVFGILFGKTPLIKLSPKKTWEGFIGAFITTVIFSLIICRTMIHFSYFYCPYNISTVQYPNIMKCEAPNYVKPYKYKIPLLLQQITNNKLKTFSLRPIYIHSFVIALFVSLIAPFGGFLASGFKRAFKIKDFGDAIPGHGGMLDRMDCQLMLSVFAYVYIYTFIRTEQPDKLLTQILKMKPLDQLELYELMKQSLQQSGLLNNTCAEIL